MNENHAEFCYCKGTSCTLREHCVRYLEGLNIPQGNGWWWMEDCEEERNAYISDRG